MNRDAEAVNDLLAWLFQDPSLTDEKPSGERASSDAGARRSDLTDLHSNTLNSSVAEEQNSMCAHLSSAHSDPSRPSSPEGVSMFNVGDIPAVQDRFQALLKRRLRAEIARKPPLFPWESESCDYESESNDVRGAEFVPAKAWTHSIQDRIPVPMSDQLLAGLLQQCQAVVQSSLQRGIQLVRAVESLFPGEAQTLNQLAGLVLTSPARSATLGAPPTIQGLPGFPPHYDAATPTQKMALSLLAAREIIDALTLKVSAENPCATQRWYADQGVLTVQAIFDARSKRLKVEADLPCTGSLTVRSGEAQASAQRTQAGSLSVELFDVAMDRHYSLDVQLDQDEPTALSFVIQLIR